MSNYVSISNNWTVAINRKGDYEPLKNGLYLFQKDNKC